MIDAASISIWATDIVLLGLAYAVGRIHGGVVLRDFYTANLSRLLDEVRLMKKKVDRMGDIYVASMGDTKPKRTERLIPDPQETDVPFDVSSLR